jgi:hypothetical protein
MGKINSLCKEVRMKRRDVVYLVLTIGCIIGTVASIIKLTNNFQLINILIPLLPGSGAVYIPMFWLKDRIDRVENRINGIENDTKEISKNLNTLIGKLEGKGII